jgi:hypothetical protein
MENIESLWQQLENPVPTSMEFFPNASVEFGQLQKDKQFLTIALVGLGIIAGVALIYFVFEEKRREVQSRM